MKREEAIAHGIEVEETKHSMKRRSTRHDYRKKGTYMLTLVVEGRVPLLGELKGKAEAPLGTQDAPRVEYSELGRTILSDEIGKIHHYYPQVEVWKVCVMPDHIHMIVRVKEDLPEKTHLGKVVRGFKTGCSRAWWQLNPLPPGGRAEVPPGGRAGAPSGERAEAPSGKPEGTVAGAEGMVAGAMVPSASPEGAAATTTAAQAATAATAQAATAPPAATAAAPPPPAHAPSPLRPVLFEEGYNDKILMHEGQLDNWKAYLDDNPRRLLMKRQKPQLFTVLHGMEVAGHHCQIVGNRFLLDIPDKMEVIVHRRYTDEENARLREEWLACGERGGVLVSAAIAPKEKEVLREAMNRGYRIILLRENGFPKLYKPAGEAFDACSEGLLLQISPWEFHMERKTITRAQCLELNAMAERIAGNG